MAFLGAFFLVLSSVSAIRADHLGLIGTATASCVESTQRGLGTRLRHFAGTRKAVALSCALLGASAGYGIGFHRGHQSSHPAWAPPKVEARTQPESHVTIGGELLAAPLRSLKVIEEPQLLTPAERSVRLPEPMARPRSTSANVDPGASDVAAEDPIGEEVALLRRADQAIRSNEPQVALGLIQELDRRFAKGKLLDERTAARVMANCLELEPEAARRMGDAYLRKAPSHVYHERVRQMCGLVERTPNAKGNLDEKALSPSGD